MSLTPSGLPAWTRTAGFETYGGDVNKRNHLSVGVIDPETDVGAEEFMRIVADLEAAVRCIPFCVIRYTCNDGSPAAPTVSSVLQQNGVNSAGYEGDSAPAGFPSLARNGDGDVTITWDSSYTDPYLVQGDVSLLMAEACDATATAGQATAEVVTATTVRVRAFNGAGSAKADASVVVAVW